MNNTPSNRTKDVSLHPRADDTINLMRAVAVIFVVIFHLDLFSNGHLGVDIFFGISGWLAAKHIEQKTPWQIYLTKRINRIVPPLAVTATIIYIISIAVSWKVNHPALLNQYLAAMLNYLNFYFFSNHSYFDQALKDTPFLHIWSLSTEIHFYMIAAILLTLKRPKLALILISITSLSSTFFLIDYYDRFYFFSPARFWQFGLPATIYLFRNHKIIKYSIFLILLLSGLLIENTQIQHHILATFITMLALQISSKSMIKVPTGMTFIGRNSYSIYLIHWPIISFNQLIFGPINTNNFILVGLILLLSQFWFSFIEQKLSQKLSSRYELSLPKKELFFSIIVGVSAVITTQLIKLNSIDYQKEAHQKIKNFELEPDNKILRKESWSILRRLSNEKNYGVSQNRFDQTDWGIGSGSIRLVIIGNSFSKDVFNAMYFCCTDLFRISRIGVQIKHVYSIVNYPNFQNSDIIVISSRMDKEDILTLANFVKSGNVQDKRILILNQKYEFPTYKANLITLSDYILLQVDHEYPHQDFDFVSFVNESAYKHRSKHPKSRIIELNRMIEQLSDENIHVISSDNFFIDRKMKRYVMLSEIEKSKVIYDYGHLTLAGAKLLGRGLRDLFLYNDRYSAALEKKQ